MTRIIGLTGGIGSGKSTVANYIASKGIPVYIADEEAKKLMDSKVIIKKIQAIFEESILTNEGNLDRKKIASIVFNSPEKLVELNNIVHPEVKKHFTNWVKKQKNHHLLLQAYAETDQLLPLVLVGQGGLQAECEALAKQLGISDKVFFVGFHSNPYPWIASATGMVLSSIYEGFGIVIAEALALDVPVISTDCESGPAEILPSNNLIPVNDADALAEKMTQLMHHPAYFSHPFNEKLLPKSVAQRYLNLVS